MSLRMEKINKHIQRIFGQILQREANVSGNCLITVSRVETARNLASTTIWLYIQPIKQAEEVLLQLKPQMYDLQGAFNRMLDLRPLPRIRLRIDYGADASQIIEKHFNQLKESGTIK